jgi:hypothetical protein
MFHWCNDESAALLASIPFIGFAWRWVRAKSAAFWRWTRSRL